MQLDRDGAQLFPGALCPAAITALGQIFPAAGASGRLGPTPGLAELVQPATEIARRHLPNARPVFARYFDKSSETNWSLAWHQDRTIAVRDRKDAHGFGNWTVKSGIAHCEPPFPLLDAMLTIRLHLDPVAADNSPLLIAPGSHRLGRIAEDEVEAAAARCGIAACKAASGDLWLYAAPILHASDQAQTPARRRVIQLAYSAEDLPGGLQWLGI